MTRFFIISELNIMGFSHERTPAMTVQHGTMKAYTSTKLSQMAMRTTTTVGIQMVDPVVPGAMSTKRLEVTTSGTIAQLTSALLNAMTIMSSSLLRPIVEIGKVKLIEQ